jgi:hypothetical protein
MGEEEIGTWKSTELNKNREREGEREREREREREKNPQNSGIYRYHKCTWASAVKNYPPPISKGDSQHHKLKLEGLAAPSWFPLFSC